MNQEGFSRDWSGGSDKAGYIYPETYPPPGEAGFMPEDELNEDPADALFSPGICSICGSMTGVSSYKGGNVCDRCLSFIGKNC
jgi:hypothetical protein